MNSQPTPYPVRTYAESNGATHYVKEDGSPLCGSRLRMSNQNLSCGCSCKRCLKIAEKA